MIRPSQLCSVNQDRTHGIQQQQHSSVRQARPPRPPPEKPTRQQPEQRRNKRAGHFHWSRRYRFQDGAERYNQVVEWRRRMRRSAVGKILERMVPQNNPWMLEAHPHSRHPRITIRVREINFAADKNLAVIRAARRQDQNGKQNDLNNRDNGPSHPVVLIENPESKIQNGFGPTRIRTWDQGIMSPLL